jgi:hypothetical protein
MKNSTYIIAATLLMSGTANPQPSISHFSLEYRGPVAYSEPTTQTIFYAESDGHHLSAITFDGKVLWTRDLYADTEKVLKELSKHDAPGNSPLDQMLQEERTRRKIVSIRRGVAPNGSAKRTDQKTAYLSIAFSSADFGIIDASTGNLVLWGRD